MKYLFLSIALFFLLGCPKPPFPVFGGKLFQGDSDNAGITRNNPDEPMEFISASDPQFDKYTCTKTQDLVNYIAEVNKIINMCKQWKAPKK
jgi:hypothetical protein